MITGRLPARLSKVILMTASACFISVSASQADYLSHRSTELFFATEEFNEPWVPRKGKMSYEQDASQPEYGQGTKGTVHRVTCAELPGIVGPNGRANHGDIVVLTSKGVCNLPGLAIHKGVTIRPARDLVPGFHNTVTVTPRDKVKPGSHNPDDAIFKHVVDAYPFSLSCDAAAAPCITVNIPSDKTTTITDFHIWTKSPLVAPLVESRSGGLVLDNNYIEGTVQRDANARFLGYAQSSAVLVHGSHAVLKNNLIVYANIGVLLLPTQISDKSYYVLQNNTVAEMGLLAIQLDGSSFVNRNGPMVSVKLHKNTINRGVLDLVPGSEHLYEYEYEYEYEDDEDPVDEDENQGPDRPPVPQAAIQLTKADMILTGNSFGQSDLAHLIVIDGRAWIDQNIFRDGDTAIFNGGSSEIHVNRNLFESNKNIVTDMGQALAFGSPFPSGNICRNQPFSSFYSGPPQVTGYVDTAQRGFEFVSSSEKKVSRSAVQRARKREPKLWDAYDNYQNFAAASEDKPKFSEPADEKKKKSRKPEAMWSVFKNFFYKQSEPVVAHVLFDRSDISQEDDYRSCFDYSTLYKIGEPPIDEADDIFLGNDSRKET